MKNILVIGTDLEIGGAERALIGLLQSFDTSKYNIDLFLLHHRGILLGHIPSEITLLPEIKEYSALGVAIQSVLKKRIYGIAYGRAIGKAKARLFLKRNKIKGINSVENEYSFKYTKKFLPMISKKEYDLVLGFTIPYYIVDEKTKGKKKIAWIHTDYSKIPGDTNSELKLWSVYDKIISISESVTEAFIKKYPSLEDKVTIVENILTEKYVNEQAQLLSEMEDMKRIGNETILLSIGRYCEAKNFDNIPRICKGLIEQGLNVKWYIIGFGGDEELIREKIIENGMQDTVILLGKKENPYPYIKNCDIYIQPSRFEGKAVTVREAQILHKPVVITNYPTASSQLIDGFDGVIVPLENSECIKGIAAFIRNKELQMHLIQNMKETNYSNNTEIEKIYQIMKA